MFDRDAASRALGIEVVEADLGRAVVRMTVADHMINGLGVCHGGLIFTLADSAMAFSSNAGNDHNLAANGEIDWIRPGRPGAVLTATATEVERNGRNAITDVRVVDDAGELVALFRGRTRQVPGTHLGD